MLDEQRDTQLKIHNDTSIVDISDEDSPAHAPLDELNRQASERAPDTTMHHHTVDQRTQDSNHSATVAYTYILIQLWL